MNPERKLTKEVRQSVKQPVEKPAEVIIEAETKDSGHTIEAKPDEPVEQQKQTESQIDAEPEWPPASQKKVCEE